MLVAVAVSGGADSTALLIEAVRRFPAGEVVAVSVDHRTRDAAAGERAYAARVAAALGCRFHELVIGPVPGHHAAWRDARLRALLEFCRSKAIGSLWLGHQTDDATETAAVRLLAGGPLTGLAGITAARSECGVQIERPLLRKSARSLRRSLMQAGIGWCEDPSNRNTHHTRVALRHVMRGMDRAAAEALVRRIGHWRAERSLLVRRAWQLAAEWLPVGAVAIRPDVWRALPPALAQEVLRSAALQTAGRAQRLRQANFEMISHSEPPWQLGGVSVLAEGDRWLVHRDARHVRDITLLSGCISVTWDARFEVSTSAPPPDGDWRIARAGATGAKMAPPSAPSAAVASLPAIWRGVELVAIPTLGIWRRPYADYWKMCLRCLLLEKEATDDFRVAP